MIYYDNAFRLRIRHTSVYQIHQHLDFFMQERKGEKLPYSFKIFPGTGDDSLLLVRTATALELPGEKKKQVVCWPILLGHGPMQPAVRCWLCSHRLISA